jgi:hypothetical protein
MLNNLIDIIASPSAVFPRLKEKPTVLLPLLLILLSTASIQAGYVLLTDPGFLVDQLVEQAIASNPNAPEGQLREVYSSLSPAVMAGTGVASTAIIILVILALNAVYLNFMGKFSFVQLGFKAWLSLLCWTGIPGLFAALASWVAILSNPNGQLPLSAVSPLSLGSLLQLDNPGTLLQQFNVTQIWSMALLVLGYQQWTGKGMLAAAVITLTPYVLLYGTWAAFTLA